MKAKALVVGSLIAGAAVAASSDATASGPTLSIASTPTTQTVATKVVGRIDARTHMRMPALRLGSATFAVVVTNPGDVALEAVGVLDPASPSCSRTIGALAAGGSVSYICHAPKVGRDFINRMTAVGRAPDGSRTLATTTATVKVKPAKRRRSHIHPIAAFTG